MADTTTTTYSLTKPEVGASADTWGTKINTNLDTLDDLLDGTTAVTGINITSGTVASSTLTGALPAIDGSGLTGVQPFPSGTVMIFYQAAAPTGWTKSTAQNNKSLRVVSGTGGGTGGSWDLSSGATTDSTGAHTHTGASHTHSTPSHSHSHSLSAGSHTLSTSQIPSHTHGMQYRANSGCWNSATKMIAYSSNTNWCNSGYIQTGSSGSGSSHSHSLSGSITSGGSGTSGSGGTGATSSTGAHTHTISAPKYIDVIVCSKD